VFRSNVVLQFASTAEARARKWRYSEAAFLASCMLVASRLRTAARRRRVKAMDVLYLALAAGFFALSWAFIVACERLG